MKYALKRIMMKKIIDKKKSKQPFDYQKGENFTLSENDGGDINNSYYFSAHSEDKGQSIYCRLGLRGDGSAEVWMCADIEGNHYSLKENFFTAETSPLKVSKESCGWRVLFSGKLSSDGRYAQCKADMLFTSDRQAIDFFYNMPSVRTAVAMAQDKWTKEFFGGVQSNNQVHYEQEGTLQGTIILDGKNLAINLPCVRDHSYGKRIWSYMNNHLWLMCVSPECQLNFSVVSYPSISLLEVGNLRLDGLPVRYVLKAEYDRSAIVTGELPQELSIKLVLDDKSVIPVKVTPLRYDIYPFEGGKYRLIESIAQFNVNGKTCRGIFEIGFNEDEGRFFNGKKTEKLKA